MTQVDQTDKNEVEVHFRSIIEPHYYEELERIFYFNANQFRYAKRITESVSEYDKPCIIRDIDGIRLAFRNPDLGQTLHIFDTDKEEASLIGVLMYVRDNDEQVTIARRLLYARDSLYWVGRTDCYLYLPELLSLDSIGVVGSGDSGRGK